MTYSKPENLTYTDMCIYIDEHIYDKNHDVDLIYKYLYLIALMLAQKANLFGKYMYYDGFALFAASKVYMRYMSPKQFEYDSNGEPKLKKLKSVLNYMKTILYPLKVDYEQTEYAQTLGPVSNDVSFNYDSIIRKTLDGIALVDFNLTLEDVSKTCKHFLKSIPYKSNTVEWLNIYTSVMLTFLNAVTLDNGQLRHIQHLQENNTLTDSKLTTDFNEEYNERPILFHLDESMSDYVLVLARQLRYIVSEDLSDILHTSVDRDFILAGVSANEFYYGQGVENED